jgi:hypothetical protein
MDRADELMTAGDFEGAARSSSEALGLAPDITELKFWMAVGMFTAGMEDRAMPVFHEVFAKEPVRADLVPRLVPAGLMPDNPEGIKRILAQSKS